MDHRHRPHPHSHLYQRSNVLPLIALLLLTAACIHKAGTVTVMEKVTTYNAALAQANNTLEQGAEAVAASGLATPAQVSPIIGASGQVAVIHQQVTAILAQGTVTTANVASIKALIDQMKAAITAIPPASLGIKNPKSQQAFSSDLNSISTLADAVLSALQTIPGVQ